MESKSVWKVNNNEVKIEINHEGIFISSNQSNKLYKYKINYLSISQRSQRYALASKLLTLLS